MEMELSYKPESVHAYLSIICAVMT